MAAQVERGWLLHKLPRLVDDTVTEALDAVLNQPEMVSLIDAMKPNDRYRVVADLLSLKLTVDADTAAFFIQASEDGLLIKEGGVS